VSSWILDPSIKQLPANAKRKGPETKEFKEFKERSQEPESWSQEVIGGRTSGGEPL
jgi:hypothetical protein